MTAGAGANTIDALVLSALPQARKMAKNWVRRRPRLELADAMSVAHERIVEAAHRFDPARGVPFPIFVAVQLRGAFTDAARADLGRRGVCRQLQQLPADPDVADALIPLWPSLPGTIDEECPGAALRAAVAQLRPAPRYVVTQLINGVNQVTIARSLGVTPARVSQVKRAAILDLRILMKIAPCPPA